MSENDDLLAKIGQLAGQINRHKGSQSQSTETPSTAHYYQPTRYQPYGYYDRGSSHYRGSSRGNSYWSASERGATARGRGRGAPVGRRHRTLVLKNTTSGTTTPPTLNSNDISNDEMQITSGDESTTSSKVIGPEIPLTGWVAKTDRHRQIINTAVYDQQAQARTQAMEKTRLEKLKRREAKEKAKMRTFIQRSEKGNAYTSSSSYHHNAAVPSSAQHELVFNSVRFYLTHGGSKLVKVPEDADKPTPKTVTVAGVTFTRSKSGNLWRSGFVKTQRNQNKISKPCKFFTMTGKCGRGQTCPYMHDPNRVAICLKFLHSTCPDGDSCDLSHDPTPNRVPACLHFLRGNCSNDDCKYAHVKVNPAAPICHDFAREGYCDKGASCPQRHVWECPDYDEKGICKVKGCKLPHIEHAGRRRLAAAAAAAVATQTGDDATEGEEPDISSDEEEEDEEPFGSDDVDSDFVDDEPFLPGMKQDDDETLAEQQDFVRF